MKKVFIVEDDIDLLETLSSILREESYAVTGFNRAKPLYKNLTKEVPDIVIADLMLPDGDGREIADFVKKKKALRGIKVILISAVDGLEKIAQDSAADAFLKKPFSFDDLVSML